MSNKPLIQISFSNRFKRDIRQLSKRDRRIRLDLHYPIVIYPCEEGGYVAEVPALQGCLAQGETLIEVLEELDIVTQLWIETAERHGRNLPDVEHAMQKAKTFIHNNR